jgi:hypothetical protein
MEHSHDSRMLDLIRDKVRYSLLGLLVFLFSASFSILAFVAYSASKLAPRSASNPVIHPMIIFSPFTLHKGNIRQAAEEPLGVPIYAGAVPSELGTFAWREGPSSQLTSSGLVVVRMEVKATRSIVDSWYEHNFPKPCAVTRHEQILTGPAKEPWFKKLDAGIDSNSVLYQSTGDAAITRGVIIQSFSDSESSELTLFQYSQGR